MVFFLLKVVEATKDVFEPVFLFFFLLNWSETMQRFEKEERRVFIGYKKVLVGPSLVVGC